MLIEIHCFVWETSFWIDQAREVAGLAFTRADAAPWFLEADMDLDGTCGAEHQQVLGRLNCRWLAVHLHGSVVSQPVNTSSKLELFQRFVAHNLLLAQTARQGPQHRKLEVLMSHRVPFEQFDQAKVSAMS